MVQGECLQMCPDSEIEMRERQRLLHPMEVLSGQGNARFPKADRNKIVKEFCRSSAGQHMQKPNVLRPYNVLMDTITYLLTEAINMDAFSWPTRYDFISDRLRAVRQDIIIQAIPIAQSICLLQPIVKFYAYMSYVLCTEKLQNFDPHLNNKHFQECLKRLLAKYDECDEIMSRSHDSINYSKLYEDNRPQIEAIYILFNLGNSEALDRGLDLSKRWKNSPEVRVALKVSLLYKNNNFVALCRAIERLPPLLTAVTAIHLPAIRKSCFQIMSIAFNSKNLQFPLDNLREILRYSCVDDLIEDVKCCGLECRIVDNSWDDKKSCDEHIGGGVVFVKANFRGNVNFKMRKEAIVDKKLAGKSVQDIVLY